MECFVEIAVVQLDYCSVSSVESFAYCLVLGAAVAAVVYYYYS